MGGGSYIHYAAGIVTNMNSTFLEQAVIGDEMVGMTMRVLRGLQPAEPIGVGS